MRIVLKTLLSGFLILAFLSQAEAKPTPELEFLSEDYDLSQSTPRLCLDFDEKIKLRPGMRAGDFLKIQPAGDFNVVVRDGDICVSGLTWGSEYQFTIRRGLPGDQGGELPGDETHAISIADAPASVGFAGSGYVLTKTGGNSALDETVLPILTMNVDEVRLRVLRIVDRNIIQTINSDDFNDQLSTSNADSLAARDGEQVWQGTLSVKSELNTLQRTGISVGQFMDKSASGVYLIVAESASTRKSEYERRATRWVVVSNLGVSSFHSEAGLNVFVNGLDDSRPRQGVEAILVAKNNKELGRGITDDDGRVDFTAGLLRGEGGNTPTALMLYGPQNDFTMLHLNGPALDLSDWDIAGRKSPGAIDGFLWGDRDIFRPGETVHLTGLLRDATAQALPAMPAKITIYKPDSQVYRSFFPTSGPSSSYQMDLALPNSAPTGTWHAIMWGDPNLRPVAAFKFSVEDFVPERLDLELSAPSTVKPNEEVVVDAKSRFLFGAPAAGLAVKGDVLIGLDKMPFPKWKKYQFGLVTDEWISTRVEIDEIKTDVEGGGSLKFEVPEVADTTLPLKATVRATVLEVGGRGVTRTTVAKIRSSARMIGLRPNFLDARVQEGTQAEFSVIALDQNGQLIVGHGLAWSLIKERYDYDWTRSNGRWSYTTTIQSVDVTGGDITTSSKPIDISAPVDWGNYRLEVYDTKTGAASSIRFSAGWRAGPNVENTPDKVRLTLDKDSYKPGDTAQIFIKPPYPGEALITVLGRGVIESKRVSVALEGTEVSLEVDELWGASGAYVAITLLRPARAPENGVKGLLSSTRAIGLAWLSINREERHLGVEIEAPKSIEPNQKITVPVNLTGLGAGERGYLTLAAVDRGILSLTDYKSPDPFSHYFGKKRLSVDFRDIYGRLIDSRWDRMGETRSGGDDVSRQNSGLSVRAHKAVAIFSGLLTTNLEGRAEVTLDIPDFNGELRLMVVAFTDDKFGSGETALLVQPPLVAELSRPRFMAPGDMAKLTLELHNLSAPEGEYTATVRTKGPLKTIGVPAHTVKLSRNGQDVREIRLGATGTGIGVVDLIVKGPQDFSLKRSFELPIRGIQAVETRTHTAAMRRGKPLVLTSDLMDDLDTNSARISVSFSTGPNLDVPRLLRGLRRYPYGCLEQTVSKAMPLLYQNELANYVDGTSKTDDMKPVQGAIWRILNMQRNDGAFGLWSGSDDAEPWLTAFAVDFLGRAKSAGLNVPKRSFDRAINWLKRKYVSVEVDDAELSVRTYALYLLARAGQVNPGDVRYLQDTSLDEMNLEDQAQLGAAMMMSGEVARSQSLFTNITLANEAWDPDSYSTPIRDGAMRLTRMAEARVDAETLLKVGQKLSSLVHSKRWLSTQEMSWLVLAAKALMDAQDPVSVVVGGDETLKSDRPFAIFPTAVDLKDGYRIDNMGDGPLFARIAVSGVPLSARPPEVNGFNITRNLFTLDGIHISNREHLDHGERYIVMLEGRSFSDDAHQALVVNLLPSGLEIENTRLKSGGSLEDFSWLPDLTKARHIELRDDRYIAAFDLDEDDDKFLTAFIVRAVTKGLFVVPPPFVEDMYRPERFARGAQIIMPLRIVGRR
jgi:alpha-2-macroglobulin